MATFLVPRGAAGKRRIGYLTCGSLALGLLASGMTAAPAVAGTCSSQTGGNSNTLIWTGTTYTCAYVAGSGNKSIGMWDTQTWTSSTAFGYSKKYTCDGQSGGVSVSYIYTDSAGTNLGSSLTYTAFNGSSGSRHWNAAVLWQTASAGSAASDQYIANCGTNYSIGANLSLISNVSMSGPTQANVGSPTQFTVTVTAPDGGGTPTGTVAILKQAVNGVTNTPTKNCSGQSTNTSPNQDTGVAEGTLTNGSATLTVPPLASGAHNLYAVYMGSPTTSSGLPAFCLAPPQSGLTPAFQSGWNTLSVGSSVGSSQSQSVQSLGVNDFGAFSLPTARGDVEAPNPRVRVVNRSAVSPAPLTASCPKGKTETQVSLSSPTHVVSELGLHRNAKGAVTLNQNGIPEGTELNLQLLCRPDKARALFIDGKIAYGSAGADSFSTVKRGSVLFAGFGNDRLTVSHRRTLAIGGPGKDRIVLRSANSAGTGGPGRDHITAEVAGSLIVGGAGRDVLVGSRGKTSINALDGRGGDTVICRSARNKVLADPGDKLTGPCRRVSL